MNKKKILKIVVVSFLLALMIVPTFATLIIYLLTA